MWEATWIRPELRWRMPARPRGFLSRSAPISFEPRSPRVLVLTFRPIRFQSDLEAQAEFSGLLAEARNRYREEFRNAAQWLEQLRNHVLEPLPLPVSVITPAGPALLHAVDEADSEEGSP